MKISRLTRILIIFFACILGFVILFEFGMRYYIENYYFPDYSGEMSIKGIGGDITIHRDKYGVPHIFAQSPEDAFFAQGFVTARDRPFQLEVYRRAAAGSLSEAIGKDFLDMDKFARIIGYREIGRDILGNMDAESLRYLNAYIKGINAGFDSLGSGLPFEFRALGLKPEKWTELDTAAFSRVVAWGNSMDHGGEYLMMRIAAEAGAEKARLLLPYSYYGLEEDTASAMEAWGGLPLLAAGRGLSRFLGVAGACNNWMIGGSKTGSGESILVFDSHQGDPRIPAEVYLVRMRGGEKLDVAGGSIVGVPGVYSGSNGCIAWGMTGAMADSQDLYRERIDPDNPGRYMNDGQWLDFEIEEQEICYREQKADDGRECEKFKIRRTVRGPIISGTLDGYEHATEAISVRWSGGVEGLSLNGYIQMNFARDWDGFRAAVAAFDNAPQNYGYADADGNIGRQTFGALHKRRDGEPPPVPAKGWEGENQWGEKLGADDFPWSYNPDTGFIATANNKPPPEDTPFYIAREFAPSERRNRIVELIREQERHSFETIMEMRRDNLSRVARRAVPLIIEDLKAAGRPVLDQMAGKLEGWDYRMDADKPEPLLFEAIMYNLMRDTFIDEMGAALAEEYVLRRTMSLDHFLRLIDDENNEWFDDTRTEDKVETRGDMVERAVRLAKTKIAIEIGNDEEEWKWGAVHRLTLRHYFDPVVTLMNVGPISRPGGWETVDRYGIDYRAGFRVDQIAILRVVVDFADPGHVHAVLSTGQSGWWMHTNYSDQTDLWLEGGLIAIPFSRDEIEQKAENTLVLKPGG